MSCYFMTSVHGFHFSSSNYIDNKNDDDDDDDNDVAKIGTGPEICGGQVSQLYLTIFDCG